MNTIVVVRVFDGNKKDPEGGVFHDVYVDEGSAEEVEKFAAEAGFRTERQSSIGWLTAHDAKAYIERIPTMNYRYPKARHDVD